MSVESKTGPDGRELYVATHETLRGNKGPFYVVYTDPDRETRWGYFCSNCETFNNAMDAMGRIQCNECANYKKPEEWDNVTGD